MPSLKDLDAAFNDVWKHTDQLPTLLDKWQELVKESLATENPSDQFIEEFERYMTRWEHVLIENRQLLTDHQETLKAQLKAGENQVSAEDIKKKFQL